MRRAVIGFFSALLVLGPLAIPAEAAPADRLTITAVVANMRAGTVFTVQIEARDASGVLDTGFNGTVSLNAAAGAGGSNFVGGTQSVAAVAGVASFNVALNDAANGYAITASAAGVNNGVSNAFSVTASQLAVLAVPNIRAGDSFNATVQARDANNNRAENFTGSVSLNASAAGGSNFAGGAFNVPAASAGTANFFGLVLSNAANGYVLTASSPGFADGVSNAFNVNARRLMVTSAVANMRAGTPFNMTVEARDGNGILAENFNSNVTLSAGGGAGSSNFVGGNAVVTATNGTVTFNGLALNDAANNYSITASGTLLFSGFSNTFNVTASHLAVSAVANVRAGDPFNVTVEARDANNNVAENFTASVALNAAATGGANFTGGTANIPAASAGTAGFTNLTLNNAADGYTLTATSPGLTDGVSNAFNVAARQLVITTVIANMQAGTPFNLTVQARDGDNNTAENFNSNVTLSAAAPVGGSDFNGGAQNANAAGGTAQFSNLALNDAADNYTINANSPSLIGATSNTFNITASHLAVSAVANVRAGDPFGVTVEARDANNNVAENFVGSLNLNAAATGGSNFTGGTAGVTATTAGAAFDNLVLSNAADGYTLTATSPGLTDGVSNAFNVTAGQLVITTVIANMQAGTPFNLTVQARDGDNNTAENFNSNVTLSAAAPVGGSDFNGGAQNANAAGGTAEFTNLALNDAADNYTINANSPSLIGATSNTFNVTASHLAVSAVANVRAGDPFNVTVEARDANNNVAENFTASVALNAAATGGANFTGGTANIPAASAGTAGFTNLTLNNAADGYTLTATSPGLTDGVSNAFNVAARQLVITTVIANMQAGTPFNLTVQARDGDNNTAENFNSNVTLSAAAPVGGSDFNGGAQNANAAGGTAQFSNLALNDAADNYTINANSPSLIGATSNTFNITAGRPDISIDNVSLVEGNSGSRSATFTVTLSQPATGIVTVGFATAGASATSGSDFVSGSGTLTFAPGETSQTITVSVNGDLLNEADEIFVLNLSGAVNATIVDGQGAATIRNDDPVPAMFVLPALALEGSAQPRIAALTVRLSAPSGQPIRVTFQTADGTAVDGVGEANLDYIATTGTLVFAPGQTEQTITISLRNDFVIEHDEYLFVDLRTPVNALVVTPRTIVVIVDDDAPGRQLGLLGAHVMTLDLSVVRKANLLLNVRPDCNALRQFARDVTKHRATYIAPGDADELVAAADRLRADIGCRH